MSPPAPAKPKPNLSSHRMWTGCDSVAWTRLLLKGKFRLDMPYWHMVLAINPISMAHSVLKYVQHACYGPRIAATRLEHDPVFIIGHWRTGTTLLHELLILDPRHNFPNTYQCMEPNHFLLTEGIAKRCLNWMLGSERPMDKMDIGFERPQEDEFALAMMGMPSPYLSFAFPNDPMIDTEAFDLEGLSARDRRLWKEALLRFCKTLAFRDPRRLVMKSPPHTCRIPTLLEMFPKAKFVYMVRNPFVVFPSTMNLWNSMGSKHGFQTPANPNLKERVLSVYEMMDERYEATKGLIPAGQLHEMKYEDLTANPLGELRQMYDKLELGGFEDMRPRAQNYLAMHKNYETNKYRMDPVDARDVAERWAPSIAKHGYAMPGLAAKAG